MAAEKPSLSVLLGKVKPGEDEEPPPDSEPGEDDNGGMLDAAQAVLDAIKADDAQALADALKECFTLAGGA